jgi:hypothetical protein
MHRAIYQFVVGISAIALLSVVAIPSAFGVISISPGNTPQTDENVQFNEPGLVGTGMVVEGITNQTDIVVTFTGNEELTTPAAGQARIEATDGSLNFLRVEIVGGSFSSLILNIDANANGNVTFTMDELGPGAPETSTQSLTGSGNNFFTITSTVGFSFISFTTSIPVAVEVSDVSQIRIGGVRGDTTVIPEAGSLVAWGICAVFGAFVAYRRRRAA